MKGSAFFRKLNFLIALGGVLAALFLYGCGNLFSSDSANDSPANLAQAKEGYGIVSGHLPSSNSANARTAMPNPSDVETPSSYKVFAQSGSQKIDATVNDTDATFSIALPFGTWKITANGLDSGGRIIFTQTKEVTLDATTSAVSLNFKLEYSTNPDDGDGEISLSVSFLDDSNSAISAIKGIEYTLSKGEEKIIQKASDAELAAGKFTIKRTTDNLGAWHLTINFYGDFSNLVYRIDQTVNVYANLRTDTFEGSAPYISGGAIKLTEALLAEFQQTTLYVDAVSGKDTNTGTQFDPLATFNRAVELVNNSARSADTEFRIFLKSDVADGATLELKSGKKLTVASADGAAHKITSLGRTFTVAAASELTVQSVKFEKLRFDVNGAFEMNGGEISGNTAQYGGAIFVATTGKAKISGAKIFGNKANEYGGGVCVYESGTFEMDGGEISENTAQYGGAICTGTNTVTISNVTISKNVSTVAAGGVYVFGGTCEMNGGTISENESADAGGASGLGGGVHVSSGTFKMNAGEISGNKAKNGGAISTASGGAVIVSGGTISENVSSETGGAIYVNGTLTMTGGKISKNKSTGGAGGGGIYVFDTGGTFIMEAGEISGNTASTNGGAVYVNNYATFTMTNGTISANTANSNGGAVYVNTSGIFTMKNGEIIGNTASVNGGGVYVNDNGTFAMQGGTFSDNTAPNGKGNGAFISGNGVLSMSGAAKFAEDDDIYLYDSNQSTFATIRIEGELSETKVATITPSTYAENRKVLSAGTGVPITPGICGKFALSDSSTYTIVPDGTGANGILKTTTVYVRGSGAPWYAGNKPNATASDANLGDIDHPFATLQKAVDAVIAMNDGASAYTIYVDGTLGMADFSALTQDLTLKIKALSEKEEEKATLNANENARVIYASTSGKLNLTLENLTITGGNASGGENNDRGGGIYFKSAGEGTLTMKGCRVTENIAGIGGGIYNDGVLTMEDCEISGNASKWDNHLNNGSGGGIYNTGNLTMTNCTVKNNIVPDYAYGGGIYNGGVLTMEGGEISGHTATNGGGIYNIDTFTMSGEAKISGNTAIVDGGGISVAGGKFTLGSGTISKNTANKGGGVYMNNATFTMSGEAKISENSAIVDGGGISVAGGKFTLGSGTISGNTATNGAGIHISGGGELTMNGGTISENTAKGSNKNGDGGGVSVAGGQFTLGSGTISENKAVYGAGIHISEGGKLTMNGGTISGNITNDTVPDSGGGGIHLYDGTFTMSGGTISGNTASGTTDDSGGGGIYIYSETTNIFTMTGGTFSGNTAANGKGAFISGNGVLSMSGAAKFAESDDVYLYDLNQLTATIQIAGALSAPSPVATITPSTYAVGREVLSGDAGTITQAVCDQFAISDSSTYTIVPDGTGEKGVLKTK